jgi:hypothetical protein
LVLLKSVSRLLETIGGGNVFYGNVLGEKDICRIDRVDLAFADAVRAGQRSGDLHVDQ